MVVSQINNGIVIDHIEAGKGMEIYKYLNLDELSCQVVLIKNAVSSKLGKKDIIKIADVIDINFEVLGYIDSGITVNIIKDGVLKEKKHLELPERVENIIKCKNPRCITSVEQELPQIFKLTDREKKVYRCIYCETKAKK